MIHLSRACRLALWLSTIAAAGAGATARAQLASTTALPRGDAKAAGFDPVKLGAIDGLLKQAVEEKQIAGGSMLVMRRGKIVHLATAGMQEAEAGVPISEATIYRIASMTKPITSVAAMMLVEDGKLAVRDPVARYIPEFKHVRVLSKDASADQPLDRITTELTEPLTVRHLLTHTSGITYGFWDRPILSKLYREAGVADGLIETPGSVGDNVRRLANVPLLFQPGTGWEYGLNTDVLGRVVEIVSGQSLDEFFESRIFKPLEMRDTHFVLPAEKRSRLAALYAPNESKIIRVGDRPQVVTSMLGTVRYSATYSLADESQYQSGGAGLASTIGDYARFSVMLQSGGQLNGRRLLKPETVAEMTRNQIGDLMPSIDSHGDKFGYGFGVVTAGGNDDEVASVGSYSWGGIFYTYFLVDPEKELVAICMAQVFPFDHLTLHGDFKRAIYSELLQ